MDADGKPLPVWFLQKLRTIQALRAKTVIEHILNHGQVTTEELLTVYGYRQAPRAARDVREQGIALRTVGVKDARGNRMAAYRFEDPEKSRGDVLDGRTLISKPFKKSLIEAHGERCNICCARYDERYLQVDHRVPYEIAGEGEVEERDLGDYQPLCGSCNRAKSWDCEHCANWLVKDAKVCRSCYWASTEQYDHIAMRSERRVDVVWSGGETAVFDRLRANAEKAGVTISTFLKNLVSQTFDKKSR